VKVAPDYESYSTLAAAFLQSNDEKSWQKTYDDYLANVEDFGLDHAQAGETVAMHFNAEHRYQDALPYAKIAADSYSGWGLVIYAQTLAHLHQYDQAEQVLAAEAERYGDPTLHYRFCVTTGHGDRAAAARACADWYASRLTQGDTRFYYGIYLLLEGQFANADDQLQQVLDNTNGRNVALLCACRALEQNRASHAAAILGAAHTNPSTTPNERRSDLCIDEFFRCLKDPTTVPSRDGKLVASFADADGAIQRGNAGYIMGRICELRHKPDDARWWYRQSLDADADDYDYRALAAEGLRRLGEDYFK
jgi:thioredoxin-like negative regulator of GroEL